MYAADTIAAIATPPGAGGIGVVRVSGPLAQAIAEGVVEASKPDGWQSSRLYHGIVRDVDGRTIDEALAVIMRAPHSYTGEDVLELQCHGSPVGLRRVLAAVLAHGARLAEAGEFTRRAFLNGRLDLAQAEAVAELIRARTDAGAVIAAEQLCGGLSDQLAAIRSAMLDIRARLEVQIDFSEDDVTVDQQAMEQDLERTLASVSELIDSYHHGRLIRDGLRVVIAGKPNVGKSSLLNALLHEDRAIVTPIPGTTRDVVEEAVDFHGIPVLLSDTAGLHDTLDPVETIGVERARNKLGTADVVVAVFDGAHALDEDDSAVLRSVAQRRAVIAINKSDLPQICDDRMMRASGVPVVNISALRETGLDALRAAVVACAGQDERSLYEGPTLTLTRHRDALAKAAESLQLARTGVRERMPPELIAVDLQDAADRIGGITGTITSEDVLDRIFSEFCIGK